MLFEEFKVKNAYIALQANMSIFAAGKTTGLVVDSGHGATNIVPVCDGIPMSDAI